MELRQNKMPELQKAFSQFKKRKAGARKIKKSLKTISDEKRSLDPSYNETLRQMFIDKALSYRGVPYRRKYHEPDSELYNSKLFLDCCGLIRRVLWDLKEEFGFKIGGGHQSYQFDTLPIVLTEEEMRPGDLIFYSGIYYPEKNLKQKVHNMVHVEIYMGEGKSLGARWGKGVVSIFDSYKFVSTNYYDIKFHYRSINTWLDGVCV